MPRNKQDLAWARRRELIGDWLIVAGALALFASLFLAWSHQFSRAFLGQWGASDQLRGVPHDPTAWQVYSSADVLLALLAAGLIVIALVGSTRIRLGAVVVVSAALAFVLHALSVPPSNGANIFDPSLSVPDYFPNSPSAGVGETIAVTALAIALAGLLLSLRAD